LDAVYPQNLETFARCFACKGTFSTKAVANCIGFGGMRVDRVVAREVLDRLQPLGIEAALAAMEVQEDQQQDKRQQVENAIQQAQFESARARKQYDAVDPDNRLVAGELERRWNEKLVQLRDLEIQRESLNQTGPAPTLSAEDRARLMVLGKDLAEAWNSPGVTVETRKKIIRLLIKEIIVDVVDDKLARRSRAGPGTATARHGNRCHPKSLRHGDGARRHMDTN
jgi:hypothetical protein